MMSKVVAAEQRRELAEYPGGIMFELGCHVIDLVVGVLGQPDKVTSFARHTSAADDGLVDNMLAVFEYPQGHGDGQIERDGSRRRRAAAPGRLRHRGDVSHSAARQSGRDAWL